MFDMNRIIFLLILLIIPFSNFAQSKVVPLWKISNLERYIDNADSVLIINFWATFCKPCIEELPYIQSTSQKFKNKNVSLLLVSLDQPEAYPTGINNFAQANKYTAPIVWLDETNADYFCPKVDKNWSGAIPATLFVNKKKGYRKLIEEQMDKTTFENELIKAL